MYINGTYIRNNKINFSLGNYPLLFLYKKFIFICTHYHITHSLKMNTCTRFQVHVHTN